MASVRRFLLPQPGDNAKDKVYPLPNMLDFVAKAPGFPKIDLRKSYHQILINPADVQKTAITTSFRPLRVHEDAFGVEEYCSVFPSASGLGHQGL